MPKFKSGDRCRVIKNLLAPHITGMVVEVIDVLCTVNDKVIYKIDVNGMNGYASEKCLELYDERRDG